MPSVRKTPHHSRETIAADPAPVGTPLPAILTSIDAQVRAVEGGPPGAGLYKLLQILASQFLGVRIMPYADAVPPEDDTEADADRERVMESELG